MKKIQVLWAVVFLFTTITLFASPQLRLSDGTTTVTVMDGDANDQSPDPGVVFYNGPVGLNWTINVTIGVTKPANGSASEPYIDLDTESLSQKAGDLKIEWTDTDFTATSGTWDAQAGGNTDGSVDFKYFLDSNNTPFGTNVALADFPNQVDVYAVESNGTFSITAPYAMTVQALIHHDGRGATGFDQSLQLTPPNFQPPNIQCAGDIDLGCNPVTITSCDTNSVIITASCGVSNITCAAAGPDTVTGCVHERDLIYTVTDKCGLSASCTQHIFWTVDHVPPSFSQCPSDVELGCSPATIPDCDLSISATDDCGKAVVNCSAADSTDGCHHTRTLTYVATDACNNKATCVQHITWNTCSGTIGDFVWNDLNKNGCQDAGEPGIAGVQVDLYLGCGSNATLVTSTTTDATGHYLFSGLCLGDYTIGFNTPVGYDRTIAHAGCANNGNPPFSNQTDSKCDCAPGTPCGVCVSLTEANPINLNIDCGYVCNGQIGNFVWNDLNGNGCQDAGEPGLVGVKVDLYSGCGSNATLIATTTTDTNGFYLFDNLCTGDYTVSFNTPAGYGHTIPHAGCANNANPPYSNQTDSKCDCAPGAQCGVCVTLTTGDNINLNVDCGYTCIGEIGDFVWKDLNGNGCQDAGEPGIPGVTVDLYNGCGTSAVFVKSTTTDATGHYLFSGLCAGDYSVKFHTPAGYAHTLALQSCNIGGQPSTDTDSNCQCTGTDDCFVCVTLTPAKFIDHSIDCGYVCNGQIGDFVWNDLNGNGCQDAGEPGIPGVTVNLYSGCGPGAILVSTTTTDATGHYNFSGLCAGDYTVSFNTPAGYTHTVAHAGCANNANPPFSNQTDSKCDCGAATPCGICVTLTPANNINLNIDCGYVCNGQIGDFVWSDTNGNGCQDAGEPGIPGVEVDLYAGCGVSGTAIATTTTDATGHYLFSGLCPGTYTVGFVTPAGYSRTIAHAGCVNNANPPFSNQTDSKCDCAAGTPCGVCVTLTGANNINLNVDCGYINCQPCLQLIKTADQLFVPIGSPAGYTYVVTNCGCTLLTNVIVVDDNGTPNNTSDDFTLGPIASLPPGGTFTFHTNVALPTSLCVSNSPGTNAGTLTVTVLPSGDIQVDLRQARTLNDNVYGTPSTADGWTGAGHKFSDLTGSDKAEFQFTDKNGKVVFDFFMDYISQATSAKFGNGVTVTYPSGYGTLGATGGDGSLVTGAASNLLSCTSTLTKDLNQSPAFYGFTANSPTPEASFPTWDYVDGYTVVVSKNAFGAAGFGGVTIPNIHNSPAKTGNNQIVPVPCGGCVTNIAKAGVSANGVLAVMSTASATVCTGTPPPPGLKLVKDVDKTTITNGATVTYTYTIQNTGAQTVNNITITDDNGTPADTSDDFVVGTVASLAPFQSQSFTASKTLTQPTQPVTMCETVGGTNLTVGELYTTVLPSGDIQVTYVQENVNDNRYGTGATAATGWASGHKFGDLTGSDEAEFRFTDKNGNVVLDAQLDYISAATSAKFGNGVTVLYPSGYGTLGPLGGDGKMISGAASNVLSVTTSLTDNLNMPQFVSGYTVNSPTETSPNSGVSTPAGWNYKDTYTIVVRGSAFGAAGFGGVTIPQLHNSPPKTGSGPFTPTNCNPCIINVATATGTAAISGTTVTASDSASVCFGTSTNGGGGGIGTCNVSKVSATLGNPPGTPPPAPPAPPLDPHKIQVAIKNNGASPIVISELDLNWPAATNGKLQNASLNGTPAFWNGPAANPPVALTTFVGPAPNMTIAAGQTGYLVLQFEKNVSTTASQYTGTVKFGTDASCSLTILP